MRSDSVLRLHMAQIGGSLSQFPNVVREVATEQTYRWVHNHGHGIHALSLAI